MKLATGCPSLADCISGTFESARSAFADEVVSWISDEVGDLWKDIKDEINDRIEPIINAYEVKCGAVGEAARQ